MESVRGCILETGMDGGKSTKIKLGESTEAVVPNSWFVDQTKITYGRTICLKVYKDETVKITFPKVHPTKGKKRILKLLENL